MSSDYRDPYTRIELCVFAIVGGELSTLLMKRSEPPEVGRWALPGGHLHTHEDKDLDDAARRVSQERLRTKVPYLIQHGAVGGGQRDMRSNWCLSVIYRAFVRPENFQPYPGLRASDLKWLPIWQLEKAQDIAFDHREIIRSASDHVRREVKALLIPFEVLPPQFTISQLRELCEQILDTELDKASFRRRVLDHDLLMPTGTLARHGPHRPAELYRPRIPDRIDV